MNSSITDSIGHVETLGADSDSPVRASDWTLLVIVLKEGTNFVSGRLILEFAVRRTCWRLCFDARRRTGRVLGGTCLYVSAW